MAKQDKFDKASKGFVIKLSDETVQKLTEEEQLAKPFKTTVHSISESGKTARSGNLNKEISQFSSDPSVKSAGADALKTNKINSVEESKIEKQKPLVNVDSTSINTKTTDHTTSKDTNTSWGDYAPYISYEGKDAIYTDPSTQLKYTWDNTSNSWTPKSGESDVPGRTYSYENDQHVYTESDGSKSFWDEEKKAWLPKVDDDFLAYYQMSYGFIDNTTEQKKKDEDEKIKQNQKKLEKLEQAGVKRKAEPQWFEPATDTNTKVYVSNLPSETSEEEFVDLMQKCGLVMRDPSTQKMKVKLYMDKEQNCFKGDALCTYIKIESVELALNLLDGSDYKGNKIKVERAQFELKGTYNPALKPKKKKKKELEKIKKMQQKLFDWRPEKIVGERSKHEKVVILKNVFEPTDFDKEVQLILDYQQDLREECSKCGEVRKVVIYDRHPEGVCQVTMKEPEEADAVVALINGRWFGKRQLTAEIWDGRTKYRIAETDADINKRIDKWGKFLEGEEKGTQSSTSSTAPQESKTSTNQEESNEKSVEVNIESLEVGKGE